MFCFALAVLFTASTQVVFTLATLQFDFTKVQQCAPFALSFTGENGEGATLATTLTIVPFNSNPVVVPIPNPQSLRGGVFSTFLPYPAGTKFIASLDNGRGAPVIKVSDVMTVTPSNDDSCLDRTLIPVRHFSIPDQAISQCQPLTLRYNNTAVLEAPKVRVYNPRGVSFALNLTSDDAINGLAVYSLDVARGNEIALLIDGGNGIRETSSLLTVTGDSNSPQTCLSRQREIEVAMKDATQTISSKAVIIGSAAGGGSIVLIAVIMCIWMVRERKRRQKAELYRRSSFDGTRMSRDGDEKPRMPPPTFVISAPREIPQPQAAFQSSDEKYLSSPTAANRPDSMVSWVQVTPQGQRRNPRYQSMAPSLALSESRNVMPQSVDDRDRLSLNSLDIEGMLNMATLQSESARKSSTTTLFGPDLTSAAPPPKPRIITDGMVSRRQLKVNSDIPDDLYSAYSRDSVNPFSTPVNDPGSPGRRRGIPSRDLLAASATKFPVSPYTQSPAVVLPVSPRTVHQVPGRSPVSRTPSSNSADWYEVGIAR